MGNWLVHHELERQAHWRSGKPAFVFEGTEYTFGEYDRRVNRTARALRDDGVSKGDTVAVSGHNHGDLFALFFACSKLGAIYTPISTFQSERNVEYICNTLTPSHVFYTADEDVLEETIPTVERAAADARLVSLDASSEVDDPTLDEFIEGQEDDPPEGSDDHEPSDHHAIFWTSGTTGRPKAVARDHTSELHFNEPLNDVFPFGPENVRVTTNDMMFLAPYLQYGLPTVAAGSTNVILRRFSPEAVYETSRNHGVDVLMLAFTQGTVLLDYLEEHDRTLSLRAIHAVVPSAKRAHALSEIADELYHIFATTETGVVLANRLEEPFDDPPTLGVPGRNADVRVVPTGEEIPPAGEAVQPGDTGELLARGETTMARYLSEENQRERVEDGWIHTGDAVRVTEAGEIVFVGRIDDRIRSGGINIYPAEIEGVLESYPGVEEAVVVGVEDEKWGQRVCALIVLEDPDAEVEAFEDALDAHCKESEELTSEMRPKEYAFVDSSDEIPTGAVNKIDRAGVVDAFFTG